MTYRLPAPPEHPGTLGRDNQTRYLDLPARVTAAAGLAVDGAVHAYLADHYALSAPGITIGSWFRVEAVVAGLVALLVIALRRPVTDSLGWLTAATALVGATVYHLASLYQASPFVDLYEPLWDTERTVALPGQGLAVVCLTPLLLRQARRVVRRTA